MMLTYTAKEIHESYRYGDDRRFVGLKTANGRINAITAERDEWKRRCEEIAKMLGDEHTLLSGHEGTDDWYCTTSRTWFPITDLSVEEGEPPQCPFSCACSNVFIAPELEITIDTLARLLAIAEGRDNG